MALLGGPFHELLFHVGDVSDDFCARHSRIGGEVETGIFFHRHGDHGWGTGTEVDGLGGGCEGDVASISCADGMFWGGGSVWIRLAPTQPHILSQSLRTTLGFGLKKYMIEINHISV